MTLPLLEMNAFRNKPVEMKIFVFQIDVNFHNLSEVDYLFVNIDLRDRTLRAVGFSCASPPGYSL